VRTKDVAIIGAGPFGLSLAAELAEAAQVFGLPMLTWRTKMPHDMLLRSPWEELSLSVNGGGGGVAQWAKAEGVDLHGAVPLEEFLRYTAWFESHYVSNLVPTEVQQVARHRDRFLITTSGGEEVLARRVVLAVGVTPFQHVPEGLNGLRGHPNVHFVLDAVGPECFAGQRVTVVGGGQSALEAAGAIAVSAEQVSVVARSKIRWFTDREPYNPRGPVRQRLYEIAYPVVGHGPPPLNRLVLRPDLFAKVPKPLRERLASRILRAGGSPWLRERMGDRVTFYEGSALEHAQPTPNGLNVMLSNGSSHETDHLVLATGYRFDLERLTFLAPEVKSLVRVEDGWPVLDRWFHSTHPGLFFVGYPAEGRFGPLCRFVLGTTFTTERVTAYLRQTG
jgi:FAD-dependent urate hydroxylase